MERFKDADGREWAVDLKWAHVRDMKARGFTLEALSPDENGAIGIDTTVAIDALLIVTADQRRQRNVSDDDFASAAFPSLQEALFALVREVSRFFRLPTPEEAPPDKSSPDAESSSTG